MTVAHRRGSSVPPSVRRAERPGAEQRPLGSAHPERRFLIFALEGKLEPPSLPDRTLHIPFPPLRRLARPSNLHHPLQRQQVMGLVFYAPSNMQILRRRSAWKRSRYSFHHIYPPFTRPPMRCRTIRLPSIVSYPTVLSLTKPPRFRRPQHSAPHLLPLLMRSSQIAFPRPLHRPCPRRPRHEPRTALRSRWRIWI